jgi:hypothetical protein
MNGGFVQRGVDRVAQDVGLVVRERALEVREDDADEDVLLPGLHPEAGTRSPSDSASVSSATASERSRAVLGSVALADLDSGLDVDLEPVLGVRMHGRRGGVRAAGDERGRGGRDERERDRSGRGVTTLP